jgi:PLP dependent protein
MTADRPPDSMADVRAEAITDSIAARWRAVRDRVSAAAERAGRDPQTVTIVAVAKTHPLEAIYEAAAAGATDVGENYVQELVAKQAQGAGAAVAPSLRWHFIGRLQRNKVKQVAGQVELIHAVDSLELAAEISKRAAVTQRVLLAVNLAGEATKSGVSEAQALELAGALAAMDRVAFCGLMTMPPPAEDAEASRPAFRALAQLRARLEDQLGHGLPVLSMGMSDDFEVAISEGATHVRIGTAIFGARPAAG